MLLSSACVSAYDFASGGIYYNITDSVARTCEVTYAELYEANYSGDVQVPSTAMCGDTAYAVTAVGDYAFATSFELASVALPESVTAIGNYAFANCSGLTSMPLPSGLTSMGVYAFFYCDKLSSVDIPAGVTAIPHYAFYNCSALQRLGLPAGLTSIGDFAFYMCSGLDAMELPDGVGSVGEGAFYGCSGLTSVALPVGIASVPRYAFAACSALESVQLPAGLASIDFGAFTGCSSLAAIDIPAGVTTIDALSFSGCSNLASVVVPSSVVGIGNRAFADCDRLATFELGNRYTMTYLLANNIAHLATLVVSADYANDSLPCSQITYSGEYRLSDATALTRIVSKTAMPVAWQGAETDFTDAQYESIEVEVPTGSLAYYQAADIWKNFKHMGEQGASGIKVANTEPDSPDGIYDLQGRKLAEPQRGINIVRGKKVLRH